MTWKTAGRGRRGAKEMRTAPPRDTPAGSSSELRREGARAPKPGSRPSLRPRFRHLPRSGFRVGSTPARSDCPRAPAALTPPTPLHTGRDTQRSILRGCGPVERGRRARRIVRPRWDRTAFEREYPRHRIQERQPSPLHRAAVRSKRAVRLWPVWRGVGGEGGRPVRTTSRIWRELHPSESGVAALTSEPRAQRRDGTPSAATGLLRATGVLARLPRPSLPASRAARPLRRPPYRPPGHRRVRHCTGRGPRGPATGRSRPVPRRPRPPRYSIGTTCCRRQHVPSLRYSNGTTCCRRQHVPSLRYSNGTTCCRRQHVPWIDVKSLRPRASPGVPVKTLWTPRRGCAKVGTIGGRERAES